jgi:hypothetical protein
MVEPIIINHYPVWSIQDGEPAEKFAWFERFVLPSPAFNLSQSYRQYQQEKGGKSKAQEASGPWREYCQVYQWRSRHQAYWRWKNQNDLEWREEKIRQHQAENLDIARLLRVKATEILESFNPLDAGPKDAAAMLRLASELTEAALDIRDIDKAVSVCHRWGLEVTLPELPSDMIKHP